MKKIIKTLVFISSLAFGHQIFAAACSDEPISDLDSCYTIPDTYTITLYEMGLCNDISEQSPILPDLATSCQTSFTNSTGSTVNVENNVTGSLSGGTSTRPDNNTYAYGFIKVDAKMIMKNQSTFDVAVVDQSTNPGTVCWTNGNPFNGGVGQTTTCGNEVDANPQNMVADIIALNCLAPADNFYCRYEDDVEGLDNTYAWLVDANGNKSINASYSETAGDVKYLIGIAKFNDPKTLNSDSTGMQAQFVVTRALNIGIVGGGPRMVNFGLNEFKVLTEVTTD
jgi:hypothetical protein